MRMKKVLAGIMVFATLTGAIAGCAPKSDSNKGSKGNDSTKASNFNAQGLPILKEKQTFEIVVSQQSATHPAKDKPIVKEIEDATNVHIEWLEVPNSSWKEKTNIMFASGDLPDAFASDIDNSLYYEQLMVLDDLISKYAPNAQKLVKRPGYESALKAPDGKIHQLPGGDEAFNNLIDQTLWINQTWLKNLGLKVPTTTDEFYNVLKAFKTQDPNKNGQADEIPLTFNGINTWATGMGELFGSFGVVENDKHMMVKDKKVIFPAQEKGYFEALQWMNKLFKEGLMDKEAFALSADQYNAKYKGKDVVGALVGWRAESVLGPEAKERYTFVAPLKGPSGQQMIGVNQIIQTEGFAITKNCKQPEVLIRWYDYINSSMELALKVGRGPENVAWEKTADGKYMFSIGKEPAGMEPGQVRPNFSFAGQTPSLWTLEIDKMMVPNPKAPADFKKQSIEASLAFGVKSLPAGTDTPQNMERRALLVTDIDTYIQKFISDAVINGIDDKKWQVHLKALETLKVPEYINLCQQFLDKTGSY